MIGGSKVLVLLGRLRQEWPSQLNEFTLESVTSVHEAAALLVQERHKQLLVDPAVLTKRDVEFLGIVARRCGRISPILLLPVGEVPIEKTREWEAIGHGALCWKDAAAALLSPPTEKIEPKADNHTHINGNTFAVNGNAEKTVTKQVSNRYDEVEAERLVSDEELQALLGIES